MIRRWQVVVEILDLKPPKPRNSQLASPGPRPPMQPRRLFETQTLVHLPQIPLNIPRLPTRLRAPGASFLSGRIEFWLVRIEGRSATSGASDCVGCDILQRENAFWDCIFGTEFVQICLEKTRQL